MVAQKIKVKGKIYCLASEAFLPEKLVMIDCEMTGVIPTRDKLLQVAMVKLELKNKQYNQVGQPLVEYLSYDGKPHNEFHKKYLADIFKICNASKLTSPELKIKIHDWLGKDFLGKATPVGDCVPVDMSFLYANDCINYPDIGDEGSILGTFHYEFFDMNSFKLIAREKTGEKEKLDLNKNAHDALVDCQNQIKELNHCLKILLN